jgi:hypothetical protein
MRYFLRFLLAILTVAIVLCIWQYFFCAQLNFARSAPFTGEHLYNPYHGLNSQSWKKCNFHAHTNSWGGFTNGCGNENDVSRIYGELGYSVASVSNYQKIDRVNSWAPGYVPTYEHGFNIAKTHQLLVGASEVTWADFLFPQTRSNKQWILDQLSKAGNAVIVLNHPMVRNGYTKEDVSLLRGFQCIEVLNPAARSFPIWDAALSAGKPVFITANDDVHDIMDRWHSGRFCTWLYLSNVDRDSIIRCLKTGKGYGMEIGFVDGEDTLTRIERIKNGLPHLLSCEVDNNNTLHVRFDQRSSKIEFIGDSGVTKATGCNTSEASYIIKPGDSYIRVAASFDKDVSIYLNPIFRYNKQPLLQRGEITMNVPVTILLRIFGFMLLIGWMYFLASLIYKKNRSIATESEQSPIQNVPQHNFL